MLKAISLYPVAAETGFDLFNRTVLRFGDLPQRASVGLVRQTQGLIQDVRRNMIRVCNIADSHPAADRLVPVMMPVDSAANEAEGVQACETHDE